MSVRNSCIEHPAGTYLVMIREEYLALCEGDHCAAALLSVFEYWHNVKLANADQAEIDQRISASEGVPAQQNSELWIYKTYTDLKSDLLGLFGETKIAAGIKYLLTKRYLATRSNPEHRWDKTPQYQFSPSEVQLSINQNYGNRRRKNTSSMTRNNADQSRKNTPAIPEITTETTTEKRARAQAHDYDDVPKDDRLQIIRAWAEALSAPPIGAYKNDNNHKVAAEIFREGYRAPQVALFVNAKKQDAYWHGKTLSLAKVAELMPEWLMSKKQRYTPPEVVRPANNVPEEWGVNHFVREVKH